jgi:hypothetical protein
VVGPEVKSIAADIELVSTEVGAVPVGVRPVAIAILLLDYALIGADVCRPGLIVLCEGVRQLDCECGRDGKCK